MKKRLLAAILCAALLIPAVAQAVSAASSEAEPAAAAGLTPKAVQYSDPYELDGEQVINVRFVYTLDSEDYTETSVTVKESTTDKEWDFTSLTVYDALTVTSKDGVSYANVSDDDLSAAGLYVVGAAVIGVPADKNLSFTADASVTTADGTVITAETQHAYVKEGVPAELGDAPEFPIPLEVGVSASVTFTEDATVYYSVTPAEDGTYPITASNGINVSYLGAVGATNQLLAGSTYIIAASANGSEESPVTGEISVSKVEEVINYLVVGENPDQAVSGDGTEFHVYAPYPGTYTITGDGIIVGVYEVSDYGSGANWEVATIEATEKGQELVFVVAPATSFDDIVVTLTVVYTEPEEEIVYLVVGENPDQAVSGDGSEFHVFAPYPGTYTITGDGIDVGIYEVSDYGYGVNWEVDTFEVTEKGQELVFVVAPATTFDDIVVTLTVVYTEPEEEEPEYLEIGLNEDKAVSGEGTEFRVVPTQPGRYTITGEGIVVGIIDSTYGGPNYEVNYIDVTERVEYITFVVGTESWA
ncbi:MAG: hypothetical protein ACI3YK_04745, partial [Eubacteriales bacterium]